MTDFDESYDGQDIVPAQSILRKFPLIIEPKQNLRVDAIVFAADALQYSFVKMRETAVLAGPDGKGMKPKSGTALLVSAWEIVNRLDAIRQLLSALLLFKDEHVALTQRLDVFLNKAKVLRNRMAHINQNLTNLAQLGEKKSPLFGALNYVWMEGKVAGKFCVASIHTGQAPNPVNLPILNPSGKKFLPPVDLFQLSAFGTTIELGPPLALLSKFLHTLSEQTNEDLTLQIQQKAKEMGVPVEELWFHAPADLSVFTIFTPMEPDQARRLGEAVCQNK